MVLAAEVRPVKPFFFIGVGRESLRDFDKTVGKTSMMKRKGRKFYMETVFWDTITGTIVVHNQNNIS